MIPANSVIAIPTVRVPRLDCGGIPFLTTTGMVEDSENETLDYGISPCLWNRLPNEGIILLKVRHVVSSNGESLLASLVVPSSPASTTVTSPNTATGTTKVPILDNKGTQVEGGDITNPADGETGTNNTTEHLAYYNKSAGIFRLLGVKAQNSPRSASAIQEAKTVAKSTKAQS